MVPTRVRHYLYHKRIILCSSILHAVDSKVSRWPIEYSQVGFAVMFPYLCTFRLHCSRGRTGHRYSVQAEDSCTQSYECRFNTDITSSEQIRKAFFTNLNPSRNLLLHHLVAILAVIVLKFCTNTCTHKHVRMQPYSPHRQNHRLQR